MKLIDRIASLSNRSAGADTRTAPILIPRITPGPATGEVLAAERRIAELGDEITQIEAQVESLAVRRRAADTTVHELSEQAAAGTLDDPGRLVKAMRVQRELAADTDAHTSLDRLRGERNDLQERIHSLRRKGAQERYHEAVQDYAKACAPLVSLAQNVREAAVDAGVLLSEHNSKHLIGTWVQIGGAVINLPKD